LIEDRRTELDRRILAVLDEYIETDDQRRDQPPYGGIFMLHRPAGTHRTASTAGARQRDSGVRDAGA
jgi:hypothetical protein